MQTSTCSNSSSAQFSERSASQDSRWYTDGVSVPRREFKTHCHATRFKASSKRRSAAATATTRAQSGLYRSVRLLAFFTCCVAGCPPPRQQLNHASKCSFRLFCLHIRFIFMLSFHSFHFILIQAAKPIKHKQWNTHKTLKLQLQLQTS